MKYYLRSSWCGDEICCCIIYRIADENNKVVWSSSYISYDMLDDEDFLDSVKEGLNKFNPEIDECDLDLVNLARNKIND